VNRLWSKAAEVFGKAIGGLNDRETSCERLVHDAERFSPRDDGTDCLAQVVDLADLRRNRLHDRL
jgi:hypothetical protein